MLQYIYSPTHNPLQCIYFKCPFSISIAKSQGLQCMQQYITKTFLNKLTNWRMSEFICYLILYQRSDRPADTLNKEKYDQKCPSYIQSLLLLLFLPFKDMFKAHQIPIKKFKLQFLPPLTWVIVFKAMKQSAKLRSVRLFGFEIKHWISIYSRLIDNLPEEATQTELWLSHE